MTLLELLAGKGATPEAVEASIRATVQDEVKQALAALQTGEQTALDAGKSDLQMLVSSVATLGETHTLKVDFRTGGLDLNWEKKATQ